MTGVLVGKFGFEQDDRDHDFYVLTLDGHAAAYTYVSHGGRDRISPKIAFRMMREMRLRNLQQFRDAIDCPLTADEYFEQLRADRQPDTASDPPAPQQPLRWVWTISGRSFGYVQDGALYTHDGRNVGRLVGGSEEIYDLAGNYIGEIHNYNTLVVVDARLEWTDDPCDAETPLQPVQRWADRIGLPIPDGVSDFPPPEAL